MSTTSNSSDEEPAYKRFKPNRKNNKNKKAAEPAQIVIPCLILNPFKNAVDYRVTVLFFQKTKNFNELTKSNTLTNELQQFLVDRKFFESKSAKSRRAKGTQHFLTAANVHKTFATQGAILQCNIRIKQRPDIKWLLVQREFNKSKMMTTENYCSLWLQQESFWACVNKEETLLRALQVMDYEYESYRTLEDKFKPTNTWVNDYIFSIARVEIILRIGFRQCDPQL